MPFTLDMRTLIFVTGTTALAMFICMLHVAVRRKTYPGFHLWSAAFLANFLGLLAMSGRNIVPDAVSILVANGFLLLAGVLICRGLASFASAQQITWFDVAAPASLLAILAYFTFVQYDVRVRTGFIVFFMAVFYLRAAWLAFRPVARVIKEYNYLLIGSLTATSLWLIFYGVMTWSFQGRIPDLMSAGMLHGLAFLIYLGLTTITMTGLISINGKRIENDLLSARQEINSLRGILPICANCKKIRDDQGYWQQVERYVTEHSEAEFTHGICPDCMATLYPELKGLKNRKPQ